MLFMKNILHEFLFTLAQIGFVFIGSVIGIATMFYAINGWDGVKRLGESQNWVTIFVTAIFTAVVSRGIVRFLQRRPKEKRQ